MTLRPLLFMLLVPACSGGASAQPSYSASLIPDSLRHDAHCVVREDHETLVVSSASRAVLTIHRVVTILDQQGADELYLAVGSDKFSHLEDAHIDVYDDNGTPIQHVRQKEMETFAFGENLIDDGATTVFKVSAPSYPVTVQTDVSIDLKGLINYPSFSLPRDGLSYQEADFTLSVPASIGIRYQNHLLPCNPLKTTDPKGNQVYSWKVTGFTARDEESNVISDRTPCVRIAPTQFEIDDRPGEMTSWKTLGQWYYDLNQPGFALPEASISFYRHMVAGAATDLEKARIIYRYLQDNFRYVNIQLGIGGMKAQPAGFTEQKKYGDCKGLSTYMMACLGAVGVKSYTALVNAGSDAPPVDPTFPYDGFDHVILCIPGSPDSTWLECTSRYTDFGVLSSFTENRYALLITENGGVLVRTPRSTVSENTSRTSSRITLAPDGSGRGNFLIHSRGEDKYADVSGLYEATNDAQKKFLIEGYYQLKQPDTCLVTISGVHDSALDASIYLTYEQIPDFTSGSKMFLPTRLYHQWTTTLPVAKDRKEDYYFVNPLRRTDTTAYILPAGYTIDEIPKGIHVSCPYAGYNSAYWFDTATRTVYSTATLTITARRVPLSEYASLSEVFNRMLQDVNEKIVITQP